MATLGFRCIDDNGLSFELLVDSQPLGTLVGAGDTAIPYWIVNDDLPYWPPHGGERDPHIRIVCVCSCGEYGCGHTRCRVVLEGDEVAFRDFAFDVSAEGSKKEFRFSRENYSAVVAEIVSLSHQQRSATELGHALARSEV